MVAKTKKKFSAKDLQQRTDGNEIDLSMSQVEEIPVKDIANIKKIDTVDLSINLIVRVPDEFCMLLQHLVKLDLSKNKLKELPEKFGLLQQLQHLDLYHNQLRLIPVSFSQLKKLKWLDVKDNPLDPSYRKHVGDCLDDKQCRQCAKSVVAAMKQILAKKEHQHLKKIEKQKKAQQLQQEQELAEMKKKERNQERKKRKKERDQKAKLAQNGKKKGPALEESEDDFEDDAYTTDELAVSEKKSIGSSCGTWFISILVMMAAISIGLYFFCAKNRSVNHCRMMHDYIESLYPYFFSAWEQTTVFAGKAANFAGEWLLLFKVECSKMVDHLYVLYDNVTKS